MKEETAVSAAVDIGAGGIVGAAVGAAQPRLAGRLLLPVLGATIDCC